MLLSVVCDLVTVVGLYKRQYDSRNKVEQAGAELCQAQDKLRLVVLWLDLCLLWLTLTWFGFANIAYELLFCGFWKVWYSRFGLVGLVR